jgi:Tfp pilus assembly protein PilN
MTENRLKTMVTAVTSAVTVLLVVLLGILVYYPIKIGVQRRRIEQLEKEIAAYEQMLEDATLDLEYYLSEEGLENATRELGGVKGSE